LSPFTASFPAIPLWWNWVKMALSTSSILSALT
jgi:hypothetical protein